MEINVCKSATSTSTIEHLRTLFASHGLPELLLSDNGSVFTSSEFKRFLEKNEIITLPASPNTLLLMDWQKGRFKHLRNSLENHPQSPWGHRSLSSFFNTESLHTQLQGWPQQSYYSRNCFLRSPLGAAKTSLKQQVVCEMRVAKTCPCKVNTFLLLKFQVEGISHLQLYTLISYIFAVQSLHKRWFQAYTSLQQGTCVLYCGPILRYMYM